MRSAFVLFIGVFSLIFGTLNYYIGYHGYRFLSRIFPNINSKIYWTVFWLFAFSYIVARIIKKYLPDRLGNIINIIGSYWLAVMFYAMLILLLVDFAKLLNRWFEFIPIGLYTSPIIGISIILLLIGIVLYGRYNASNPIVTHYDINIDKTAGNLNTLRVVALSDIHIGANVGEKRMIQAADMINALNPDVVLLVGDTIDEDINIFKEKNMADIFSRIKSKLGNFAVLGNHEYIGGHLDEAVSYIEKSGFKVLRDSYIKVNDAFYIIGRDDKSANRFGRGSRKDLIQVMNGVDVSLPTILLDHQPSNANEPPEPNIDLKISGHTHKGQMFPNEFITDKIFKNDYGYLKEGTFNSVVSSGFGTWGPPIRIGNNSEIVQIDLHFK